MQALRNRTHRLLWIKCQDGSNFIPFLKALPGNRVKVMRLEDSPMNEVNKALESYNILVILGHYRYDIYECLARCVVANPNQVIVIANDAYPPNGLSRYFSTVVESPGRREAVK